MKLILMLLWLPLTVNAQIMQVKFCECKKASLLKDDLLQADSVFSVVTNDSNSYNIKVYNTGIDTIYLFSSYLQPRLFTSPYLHRVDNKKKEYKLSFVPLIPFLYTKQGDVLSISNNIVGNHQIVYDFIKMYPHSYYEFSVPISEAFTGKNAVVDVDVKQLNKFDRKVRFKTLPARKMRKKNYQLIFELAYYKDVSVLCKESDYYLRESLFNKHAQNFVIIKASAR